MNDRIKVTKAQRARLATEVETCFPVCEWCRQEITPDDNWVVDHRVPSSALTTLAHQLVGEHWRFLLADDVNLQPMHRRCNIDKGDEIHQSDVRDLRHQWNDAIEGLQHGMQSILYERVRDAMNQYERRQRQLANLELQLPLFEL